MADVIKEFLVSLGFKYDEHGLRRFEQQVNSTRNTVRAFALTVTGMALSIEESIRRTAREFENLFYLSQRTNISIDKLKAIDLAFKQIGLTGEQMTAQFAQFNLQLMQTPGLRHVVTAFVGAFKDPEEAMVRMAGKLDDLIKLYGRESAAVSSFLANAQEMGFDVSSLVHLTDNLKTYVDWQQRALEIRTKFGLVGKKEAEDSRAATMKWNEAWFTLSATVEKFTVLTFPALTRILDRFTTWMTTDGIKKIQEWADKFDGWLSKEENIKNIEQKLILVGEVLVKLAVFVGKLLDGFQWLSDKIGPLEALVVSLFTVWAARLVIVTAATWALNAATAATANSIKGMLGALGGGSAKGGLARLGFLGLVGASAVDAYQQTQKTQEEREKERTGALGERPWWAPNLNPIDLFSKLFGGGNKAEGDPGKPHSYGGSPVPAFPSMPSEMSDALYLGFRHWWSGSGAFRPIVVLGDEVYKELTDLLREVFGLNPAGGTVTGSGGGMGGGAGAGEGGGSGTAGRGGPGGRFRGAGPGAKGEGTQAPPPGSEGQYRPKYSLSEADLSDAVINTIAGEATSSQESTDAVINNMFNRLGTKGYGPSGNLLEVASAPGQYAAFGRKQAGAERAAQIRERIKAIASGAVPDITQGANEFRTGTYMGPWGQKHANAPVIGGNRFAYNPAGGLSPYAPYSQTGGGPQQAAAGGGPQQADPNLQGRSTLIVHHTAGRGTAQDVMNTLKQRGLGVQYIMDREGKITETGMKSAHIRPGQGVGKGLTNENTAGIEIIAKDDRDITPAQVEAMKSFYSAHPEFKQVFGHGEVNPHKQHSEGETVVRALRAMKRVAQDFGGGGDASMVNAPPSDSSQMFGGLTPGGAVAQRARQQVASNVRQINSVQHVVINGTTTPEGSQTALFQQNDKSWNRLMNDPAVA